MLVVNTMGTMEGSIIYEQKVDFPLCTSNDYYFCIYASSITSFDCTPANLELRIGGTRRLDHRLGADGFHTLLGISQRHLERPSLCAHMEQIWPDLQLKRL